MFIKFLKVIFLFFCISFLSSGWAQSISFGDEILPVIIKKCANCHYENGYAPFALTNFEEVQKHIKEMAIVIKNGSMPPWKADRSFRKFAGDRSLTDTEKVLLLNWINSGAINRKSTITKNYATHHIMDTGEILLKMTHPFTIKASLNNTYISYKIPFELDSNYAISALRFIPGNKSVVHHATYQIFEVDPSVDLYSGPDFFTYDEDSNNRVIDFRDFSYFNMLGKNGAFPKELYHGGWLPGTEKIQFPKGVGFTMPKRGILLIRSLHYSPSSIDVLDQSALSLFISKNAIERPVGFAAFQPRNPSRGYNWVIPADTIYRAHINVRFTNDVSILYINPHMHLIGKSFKAFAVSPKGDTIPLVHIPDWDFNWQDFYRFEKMVHIPAGSILHAEATYDNTNKNPFNPNFPAKAMPFETGMNESNEMMRLVILYLPYLIGDENVSLE